MAVMREEFENQTGLEIQVRLEGDAAPERASGGEELRCVRSGLAEARADGEFLPSPQRTPTYDHL
jgi:hypothetical protein